MFIHEVGSDCKIDHILNCCVLVVVDDLACREIEVVNFDLFLVAGLLLVFIEVLMGEDKRFSSVSFGRLSLRVVSLSIFITRKCII